MYYLLNTLLENSERPKIQLQTQPANELIALIFLTVLPIRKYELTEYLLKKNISKTLG